MAEIWLPPTFDEIATDDDIEAVYLNKLGNSLRYLAPVAVATPVTSDVVVDVLTAATSQLVIAAPAVTYEAIPYELLLSGAGVQRTQVAAGSPSLFVGLYDGSAASPLDRIATYQLATTNLGSFPVTIRYPFTPTPGSHTFQIRAYTNTADSWTFLAGAGGVDLARPLTLEIYRRPT